MCIFLKRFRNEFSTKANKRELHIKVETGPVKAKNIMKYDSFYIIHELCVNCTKITFSKVDK